CFPHCNKTACSCSVGNAEARLLSALLLQVLFVLPAPLLRQRQRQPQPTDTPASAIRATCSGAEEVWYRWKIFGNCGNMLKLKSISYFVFLQMLTLERWAFAF